MYFGEELILPSFNNCDQVWLIGDTGKMSNLNQNWKPSSKSFKKVSTLTPLVLLKNSSEFIIIVIFVVAVQVATVDPGIHRDPL